MSQAVMERSSDFVNKSRRISLTRPDGAVAKSSVNGLVRYWVRISVPVLKTTAPSSRSLTSNRVTTNSLSLSLFFSLFFSLSFSLSLSLSVSLPLSSLVLSISLLSLSLSVSLSLSLSLYIYIYIYIYI